LGLGIWCLSCETGLGGLGNQPRAKASRTDFHANRSALFEGLHLMEVGVPNFLSLVIGMTNIMAKDRPFPTDVANFRHD
jgi:hypothetical protein